MKAPRAKLLSALTALALLACQGALGKTKSKSAKAVKPASGKQAVTSTAAENLTVNFSPYPPGILHPIRIGLGTHVAGARVAFWAPGAIFIDNRPVFSLKPQQWYYISGGRVVEQNTGRSFVLPRDKRAILASSAYIFWTNNRWYRGVVELISFGGTANIIDLLDLEDYLQGVVPSEMPSNWPLEALKAQAVAARSYAWAHMGSGSKWMRSEGYDLVPDVRDQAYKGLAAEANSSSWAVKLTHGYVLKDAGRVKSGFYRAWVGDDQENLNIRSSTVPESLLEQITGVPHIIGVTVKQWDADGNARALQILGQKKTREVYGVALAKMLNFSTPGILDVEPQGNKWIFTYRGPGNGIRGLSQHGAAMLAKRGWSCWLILQQYYEDPDGHLRLASINPVPKYFRWAAPPKDLPPGNTQAVRETPVESTSDDTTDRSGEKYIDDSDKSGDKDHDAKLDPKTETKTDADKSSSTSTDTDSSDTSPH
jgi:stage II sporulation protein D